MIGSAPDNILSNATSNGLSIFLSNNAADPFRESGTTVPPGSKARIILSKFVSKNLGNPYSNCVTNTVNQWSSDLFKLTKALNYSYSQDACMDLCYQQNCIQNCGCYDPRYEPLDSRKQCLMPSELNCLLSVYYEFLLGK